MASEGAGINQAAPNRTEAPASFRALLYIVAPFTIGPAHPSGHASHEQAGDLDWSTSSLAKVREDTEAALRGPRGHAFTGPNPASDRGHLLARPENPVMRQANPAEVALLRTPGTSGARTAPPKQRPAPAIDRLGGHLRGCTGGNPLSCRHKGHRITRALLGLGGLQDVIDVLP